VIAGWSHWSVSLLYIGFSLIGLYLSVLYFTAAANVELLIVSAVAIGALSLWILVIMTEKTSQSPAAE